MIAVSCDEESETESGKMDNGYEKTSWFGPNTCANTKC